MPNSHQAARLQQDVVQYSSLAWYAWPTPIRYRQSALVTNPGALIPECNGLPQFRQDTGKPSVLAQ